MGSSTPSERVSISRPEAPVRENFVNPLDNMFEPTESRSPINDTGSSARNDGDLSAGTVNVGAEAHSGTSTSETTTNGNTTTQKDLSKEAHAGAALQADLSRGQVATSVEAGASLKVSQNGTTRGETQVGPATLRGEVGGQVDVNADAGFRSRSDVDLSQGTVDLESGGSLGVDYRLGANAGGEIQVGDTTLDGNVSASTSGVARVQGQNRFQADQDSISTSSSAEARASLAADATIGGGIRNENGSSLNGQLRGEASVFAEAHASSNFTSTPEELSFGGSAGASAAAQLQGEGTLSGQTANGSSFRINGGVNTGSVGAGIEGGFSRTPGSTSLNLGSYGALAVVGGHLNGAVTVADRDVGEAVASPLNAAAGVSNAVGNVAQSAGEFTESTRQAAEQRQQVLNQMADYPSGSFVTDLGNDVAATAHGAYTGAVNVADNVVDTTAHVAHTVGEGLSNAGGAVADGVEYAVGATMDTGVRAVNNGYQAVRSFGSWLNPFD